MILLGLLYWAGLGNGLERGGHGDQDDPHGHLDMGGQEAGPP